MKSKVFVKKDGAYFVLIIEDEDSVQELVATKKEAVEFQKLLKRKLGASAK